MARNIQGSNSIEGYVVGLDEALEVVDDQEPVDVAVATLRALSGYRDAMSYVLQAARDPHLQVNESLLKSLHFMMLKHELRKHPGQWRPGPVYVLDERSDTKVYEGPPWPAIPELVAELVAGLARADGESPVVRATMAHLNLVMIHPFSDGNGRMARCLQTLVLANEGIIAAEFSSVEEYLGQHTDDYYAVLAQVGRGSWRPDADARPWLEFMIRAHYRHAAAVLERMTTARALWDTVEDLVGSSRLPPRTATALFDLASGQRLRRSSYLLGLEEPISTAVASRDLKAVTDTGLARAVGDKRGRYYVAGTALWQLGERARARTAGADLDPYEPDEAPALF